MASKLPMRTHIEPVAKIITDLDQSDEPRGNPQKSRKSHRHREKKDIKNYAGNFVSRSRSADNRGPKQGGRDEDGYLKVLIKTKDDQIEKLVEKISELHTYNNQFAQENDRLKSELTNLNESLQSMGRKLEEIQNQGCSACAEWKKEKNDFVTANRNLKDDVSMMKTLVYRLNVQLERYQDKLRKSLSDAEAQEIETTARYHTDSPLLSQDPDGGLNWGPVNSHTLSPLLNAYEEMVKEKDDLIQQHEREINRFTGNLKEIIEENERLHHEMDDLRKGQDGWREERTRLQAQLEICRSKAELQTRRADLAKEKLVEVLRCYEQKVQAQSLDLERLQDAYSRAKTDLISIKNIHAQPETVVESLKECQRLFEELKSQHGNEKTKISVELSECRKQIGDLEEKLSKLRDENSVLKASSEKQNELCEELKKRNAVLKDHSRRVKESRDKLKSRLRIALQWAQKLEEGREKVKNTWDELKELEAIVRHKEAQIRGLQSRHIEEVDKLQKRLEQREETIRNILKERAKVN